MTALPHEWEIPSRAGWTRADVLGLPEDCRAEVIEGTLVVNPSPLPIHQRLLRRLATELDPQIPPRWQFDIEVDVMLTEHPLTYLTPDIVVFDSGVSLTTRPIRGASVLLVAEIVSPGSRTKDRGAKPLVYAEAGIPYLWRIETPSSGATETQVHTFTLDNATEAYASTGVHQGRLVLDDPFPVKIELGPLTR
jgi:Uma2 family endonuclease